MTPWLIVSLTFAGSCLLVIGIGSVVYDLWLRHRAVVNERVAELSGASAATIASSPLFRDISKWREAAGERQALWERAWAELLEQSGLGWSAGRIAALSLGTAALAGAAAYLGSGRILFGILAGAAAATTPTLYLMICRRRRNRVLSRQLPDAFDSIARAVRAGHTVPAAMRMVGDEFEAPISEIFSHCQQQQDLGISSEVALRQMAQQSGIMELRIFVVAMMLQTRSGGNLIELLQNLSTMVRRRMRMQDRVRALTGEGRMQALVLSLLPIAALGIILFLAPDYAQFLLDRPWVLAATAGAQAVGILWIRKIINFDY